MGVLCFLTVLLLFIFLITAAVECFLYLFVIRISSLVKYQFRSFTWFFLGVVYFLIINIFGALYILCILVYFVSNIKGYFKYEENHRYKYK